MRNSCKKVKILPVTWHKGTETEQSSSLPVQTTTLEGMGGQSHALTTLLPGKSPVSHCKGSWEGPRAGINGCGQEGISCPHRGSKHKSTSRWRAAIREIGVGLFCYG
jgi:hypothetical protein